MKKGLALAVGILLVALVRLDASVSMAAQYRTRDDVHIPVERSQANPVRTVRRLRRPTKYARIVELCAYDQGSYGPEVSCLRRPPSILIS